MSFLIACPLCGPREVGEFRYGGEVSTRPAPSSNAVAWSDYLYARTNAAGPERAWWLHRAGCRRWFQVERDTRTNVVTGVSWPPTGAAPVPADALAADTEAAEASADG
ncbi:MAG TPA: sarcosine oxidase subunit delta [Vitreimonas sp.]|nr:sarcosine oxidase subunit delta [Vitreimonas sp.]